MLQAIADRPCMTTCGATIDGFGMASPGKIAGRLGSAAEGAPIILAIAAGVACTASTEGACGPLAWSALSSGVLKSAHDDGVLGGGRAHKGRFVADVAIASSFYGLGKALEAASSPYFIQTKGDQRQFRGIGNAILFVLDLLQHAAR